MKMRHSLGFYTALLLLLPLSQHMAVGSDTPIYTHYIYMFAHAGWLHWALNGFAWALLWKIITPARTLVAYLFSVLVSFLLPGIGAATNVIGWSVIIFWYWGFLLPGMMKERRLRFLALVAGSFFIPGIAASWHFAMLVAGYVSRKIYNVWQRTER